MGICAHLKLMAKPQAQPDTVSGGLYIPGAQSSCLCRHHPQDVDEGSSSAHLANEGEGFKVGVTPAMLQVGGCPSGWPWMEHRGLEASSVPAGGPTAIQPPTAGSPGAGLPAASHSLGLAPALSPLHQVSQPSPRVRKVEEGAVVVSMGRVPSEWSLEQKSHGHHLWASV